MRIITIANTKGGSAKTTTTVCLASAFAERALHVLVVDLDPQGSASQWLGGLESAKGFVTYADGGIRISELVSGSSAPGVDLIPAARDLVADGDRSPSDAGLAVARAFARLPDYWDLVLVDTPPGSGYLSLAPLVASDDVVIPAEARALAMTGVATAVASAQRARGTVNSRLRLLGIVASRVNATTHSQLVVARLRTAFGPIVLDHVVRDSIRVAEAPGLRLPITVYAPTARASQDFREVADELLGRLAKHGH